MEAIDRHRKKMEMHKNRIESYLNQKFRKKNNNCVILPSTMSNEPSASNETLLPASDENYDWKEDAKQEQQEFYSLLGDRKWDLIRKEDWTLLVRKVAYGIYGPPSRMPVENNNSSKSNEDGSTAATTSKSKSIPNNENTDIGYTPEQMKVINEMCLKIQEQGKFRENKEDIWFACIFICGQTQDKKLPEKFTVPVFKTLKLVKDGVDSDLFIDTNCRVYDGWDDYLQNNRLPQCEYCYPRNGTYTGSINQPGPNSSSSSSNEGSDGDSDSENTFSDPGEAHIDYGFSPACKISSKVLSVTDRVATYVTWGSTAVAIAALCTIPVAGPIAAAATVGGLSSGAYVAGRSAQSLYDRKSHGQSIGVKDSEARNCWLTVVGGTLGFAQARMIQQLAKAAEVGRMTGIASRAGQSLFFMVNVGCVSVSGLGIISSFVGLLEKKENNELTKLDILQFSASCLFFTHSLVNFKTAESIIKEVQHDVIDSHRQGMAGKKYRNQRSKFNKKLKKNVSENGELHGNANVVKSINNIRNTKEFYKALVEPENHQETEINVQAPPDEEVHLNSNAKKTPANAKVKRKSVQKPGSVSGARPTPSPRQPNQNQNINQKNQNTRNFKFEIDAKTKLLILSKAQLLAQNLITSAQFRSFMEELYKKYEPKIKRIIWKLCKFFRVDKIQDIQINGYRIFEKLTQIDIMKLAKLLADIYFIYGQDILRLVAMLAQLQNCKNDRDFVRCLLDVGLFVKNKFNYYERLYQQGRFDIFVDNPEERVTYFRNMIYGAFDGERENVDVDASLAELYNFSEEQEVLRTENSIVNPDSNLEVEATDLLNGNETEIEAILEVPSFMENQSRNGSNSNNSGNDSDADNCNFEKCETQMESRNVNTSLVFSYQDFYCEESDSCMNETLCKEQYIQMASELLNLPLRGDALLSQEDNATFLYFSSPVDSAFGVKIEKIGEEGNYFGIATLLCG